MLSDVLLSRLEISALCSALSLASDRALVFPATGSGAPRQRPIPGAQLQFWLRVVLRLTSFQIVWALLFFVLSFSSRRSLIGAVLNLPYAGAAALGLLGALKLSYAYVSTSLLASLAVDVMFLSFCLWSYFGTGEWVVLTLYLPGLAVDFFVLSCCFPLALHLYRAEHSTAYPSAYAEHSTTDSELAGVAATRAQPQIPEPRAEPTSTVRAGCASAVAPALVDEENGPLAAILEFRCPITLGVMVDPVIAADGHSYERVALEAWLTTHRTSPFTGAALEHMHVTPNHRLRSMIESARETALRADD